MNYKKLARITDAKHPLPEVEGAKVYPWSSGKYSYVVIEFYDARSMRNASKIGDLEKAENVLEEAGFKLDSSSSDRLYYKRESEGHDDWFDPTPKIAADPGVKSGEHKLPMVEGAVVTKSDHWGHPSVDIDFYTYREYNLAKRSGLLDNVAEELENAGYNKYNVYGNSIVFMKEESGVDDWFDSTPQVAPRTEPSNENQLEELPTVENAKVRKVETREGEPEEIEIVFPSVGMHTRARKVKKAGLQEAEKKLEEAGYYLEEAYPNRRIYVKD